LQHTNCCKNLYFHQLSSDFEKELVTISIYIIGLKYFFEGCHANLRKSVERMLIFRVRCLPKGGYG